MTTTRERLDLDRRMTEYGIAIEDRQPLRRIAMTLQRWHELECGTERGGIERDERTNKCYWYDAKTGARSWAADRETGALRRLAIIMARYPQYRAYVQGDPRGASLYLVPVTDLAHGEQIDAIYSQGLAIY